MELWYLLLIFKKNPYPAKIIKSFKMSFAPNTPYFPKKKYFWRKNGRRKICEVPLASLPVFRLPFYSSFHMFVGPYFSAATIKLMKKIDCNYLFHSIDFLDPGEIDKRILKHPNASKPLEEKLSFCKNLLTSLSKHYRFITTKELVKNLKTQHAIIS